jgi:hypothetical protein
MLNPPAEHSRDFIARGGAPGAFGGGEPTAPVGALQSGDDFGD